MDVYLLSWRNEERGFTRKLGVVLGEQLEEVEGESTARENIAKLLGGDYEHGEIIIPKDSLPQNGEESFLEFPWNSYGKTEVRPVLGREVVLITVERLKALSPEQLREISGQN